MRALSTRSTTVLRVGLTGTLLVFAASTGFSPTEAEAAAPSSGVVGPAPNVLLLIDRSGSMARTTAGNVPNCVTGADSRNQPLVPMPAGDVINMDRWGQILEGLTGHVKPYYTCETIDRTSTRFKDEYSINLKQPPDADYIIPYNRPLSDGSPANTNTCAVTPGFLPGATGLLGLVKGDNTGIRQFANGWDGNTQDPNYTASKGSIVDRFWANTTGLTAAGYGAANPAACTFNQYGDGQLDVARKFVRFSLMTSDSEPSKAPTNVSYYGVTGGTVPWSDLTTGTGTSVDTAHPFDGQWSYLPATVIHGGPLPKAKLQGCATDPDFSVGARHLSAPPWEGRHVAFPAPDGPDDSNLDQIQRVLLATRPYGGSPLDGMMYDAADYLWRTDDFGPWAVGKTTTDDFVQAGCRQQYVVLVSDGASNLDLRPACKAGAGVCPFPTPVETAHTLYTGIAQGGYPGTLHAAASAHIKTFVIGFSAVGSHTPPVAEPAWWTWGSCTAALTAATSSKLLADTCATKTPYVTGTMSEACCTLNDIAVVGDGYLEANPSPQGAFFVDSEAEFSLAMGKILGTISSSTTSRATPTFSSTYTSRDTPYAGGNANASFITTLNPQPGGLWTSDIQRKRNVCNTGTPNNLAPVNANDDKFANATVTGSKNNQRFILTAVPNDNSGVYDPTVTFRPFDTVHTDNVTSASYSYSQGQDIAIPIANAGNVAATLAPDLFNIAPTTCGSVNILKPTLKTLPKLTTDISCENAVFAFATGYAGSVSYNASEYNVRCTPGDAYTLGCNPLGGVYHSQPIVAPPPQAFLADEGYRAFAKTYAGRPSALYVETMDGLLHAFDATNDTAAGPYANELFSFIPPAVLPTLASNYPSGAATLLDSSPAVKDVVWNRVRGDIGAGAANLWHTMLVAGQPGGYFAMEISDPLVGQISAGQEPGVGATYGPYKPSVDTGSLAPPAAYQPVPLAVGDLPGADFESGGITTPAARPVGPHFMWQLTTADKAAPERLSSTGSSRATGTAQYPLFGDTVSKPAITTLYFQDTAVSPLREVGVAILPGGMPLSALTPGECLRQGGVTPTVVTDSGAANPYTVRTKVRNWGDGCTSAALGTTGVRGRSVSIVRLDTGEIIRVFARKVGVVAQDLPNGIPTSGASNRVNATPLDSPMTGTPIVYPADVGAVAQRFYMGDADGMIWRFDVSDPNPDNWKGRIFYDTQNITVNPTNAKPSLDGQPIVVDPIVTQDQQGRAVLIVATGEQDVLNQPKPIGGNGQPPKNFVVSLTERPDSAAAATGYYNAYVNWVYDFPGHPGERVTGPMTVFNNVAYFASYYPPVESVAAACTTGSAYINALDYIKTTGVYGATQIFAPIAPTDNAGTAVKYVPGVTVQAGLQCATAAAGTSSFGAYQSLSFSSTALPTFTLSAMSAKGTSIGGAGINSSNIPTISAPAVATIDSWAAVVE